MSKLKLPIIIAAVVLAAVAGLYMSGMLGSKSNGPVKKHVVEPVPLANDFTVNLKDGSGADYATLTVALQLEPMGEEEWVAWSGADAGGHGGSAEAPGPVALSTYPKLADAVNEVTSTFTAQELKTPEGKADLKQALLERFSEIAEQDAADYKAGAKEDSHVGPPYHVMDVFFTRYLVKG